MLRLGIGPDAFVERHRRGDWGNVNAALVRENAVALKGGFRLLSAYGIGGEIFYVITEADRSSTTIFLHEYY